MTSLTTIVPRSVFISWKKFMISFYVHHYPQTRRPVSSHLHIYRSNFLCNFPPFWMLSIPPTCNKWMQPWRCNLQMQTIELQRVKFWLAPRYAAEVPEEKQKIPEKKLFQWSWHINMCGKLLRREKTTIFCSWTLVFQEWEAHFNSTH